MSDLCRSPRLLALLAGLILTGACGAPTASSGAGAGSSAGAHAPAGSSAERSARPGVNDRFLAGDVDVDEFVRTFEGESREIAAQRAGIALHLGLRPGMAVADIGAGTGLFMDELARGVGREGKVYAVDLAPAFVEHLRERAADAGLKQVQVVQCTDHAVGLPAGSIDVALVCDTYHHFEYPQSTLASLREALRPGGLLAIVDFERTPDSRAWVLDHVRADSGTVIAEVEAAGFHLVDRPAVSGLSENYLLRFRKS